MNPQFELRTPQSLAASLYARIARLHVAQRRAIFLLALAAGLGLFLLWLPPGTRLTLALSLVQNRTLVGLLSFFALLALSLLWSAGQRVDVWVFLRVNLWKAHPTWLDRAMWLATQLGNMAVALAFSGLLFLLRERRLAVEIVLGLLTLWLVVEFAKALTDRVRPFVLLKQARVIGIHEPGLSFPSGHTAQSFFLAFLLVNHFEPGLLAGLAVYLVAAGVGITRLYVGVHYPRDVLAGAILGVLWGLLIATVVEQFYPPSLPPEAIGFLEPFLL